MGVAMVDFTLRECAEVIDGQIVIIRIGTCGTPKSEIKCGDLVVQEKSIMINRNPDGFRKDSKEEKYRISQPVDSNKEVTKIVNSMIKK
jgi:uridine phosphorylase